MTISRSHKTGAETIGGDKNTGRDQDHSIPAHLPHEFEFELEHHQLPNPAEQ